MKRLHLRDTELHDDIGGGGQRIWTTAGQGYVKTWFVEEAPVADLLRRAEWEIRNLQEKIGRKEPEGWEGSRRRAGLRDELAAALALMVAPKEPLPEPPK